MTKKSSRLNIEIDPELQKKMKNFALENNSSIKNLITDLIKSKVEDGSDKSLDMNIVDSNENKAMSTDRNSENAVYSYKKNNFKSSNNNKNKNSKGMFKIGLICGGPSSEKGISLNSARSILDHLDKSNREIVPFFVDHEKNVYKISRGQLYSNTPSDFDFKLKQTAIPLSQIDFINELKNVDIVFPVIHGEYGEDGELQYLLEQNNIPFVGSHSYACRQAFSKKTSSDLMREKGFFTFPSIVLKEEDLTNEKRLKRFFDLNKLKKAIVKPVNGGSSIGVRCVYSDDETLNEARDLFKLGLGPVIVEPFCIGREFTIIVLQNSQNEAVALLPSEIEMKYESYQIFDYRRKYLPTVQTRYHTPARFKDEEIEKVRDYVEEVFDTFELKDIVRIDGWLLNDGRIWFSDINPFPGTEQNSFVFQQSARVGLNHSQLMDYILASACKRHGIELLDENKNEINREPVNVLFGGSNAERHVSLMSGTNIWLKLRESKKYDAKPFMLDKNGFVWSLPYFYTLSHTVEEIYENCLKAEENKENLERLTKRICKELGISQFNPEMPVKMTFDEFIKKSKKEEAFVFLGLHGGVGEDGTIQKRLDEVSLLYNGSDFEGSSLGMDKYKTGEVVKGINDKLITTAPKIQFYIKDFDGYTEKNYEEFWTKTISDLNASSFIIKPGKDGCSAGTVRIYDHNELRMYVELINDKAPYIPANTFKNQSGIIEMPSNKEQDFLLEAFIEVDEIYIRNGKLSYTRKNGWVELTVGVLESQEKYHSMNPSITVAEGDVLTVEEKFQGGTGVNITPPPSNVVSKKMLEQTKEAIEKVAKAMNIKNYARIDIFLNVESGKVIVIEANTLPALTPSTVIYHQALAENPSMNPTQFLEKLIEMKKDSK